MAFDAGSIEATLTLNRNPFTAGLLAAKKQGEEFARKKFTATLDLDAGKATAEVIAFKKLLKSVDDQTVTLRANTRAFGSDASNAAGESASRFEKLGSIIVALAPIVASAATAAGGAIAAIASAAVIAGAGAGAFALVAIPAFKKVKDAVGEGQEAINKLPPGLREAGNALQDFNKEYEHLKTATQGITGLALAAWFSAGTAALKTLQPLITTAAEGFRIMGMGAKAFFEGPWWQGFVNFVKSNIVPVLMLLWSAVQSTIKIVGNLTMAFWNLGGSEIMGMIVRGLADFAKWTETIGQNTTFIAFMDAAKRSLPVVGGLIKELLDFIIKLVVGLEPLGTVIIRVLDGIFSALNKLPPSMISAIALAIGAVWAAIALGASGPVGIAIGVLAGLAVIFLNNGAASDTFQTKLDNLVNAVKTRFLPIWDTVVSNFNTKIKPAWDAIVAAIEQKLIPALQKFGDVFMEYVWPKIQPFVNDLTGIFIPAVLNVLKAFVDFLAWMVNTFGPGIAAVLSVLVTTFHGTFDIIAGLLNVFVGLFTGNWKLFGEGLKEISKGFWTIVAGIFGMTLDQLRDTFAKWDQWFSDTWHKLWDGIKAFFQGSWDTIKSILKAALDIMTGNVSGAADEIGKVWRKVANFFREPINWVIRTVIGPPGGLAGAWNTVMGWIGQPQLNVSAPPQIPAFADGGRVRGPGTGTSDEILARLSNGEYVVPERITKKIWPFLEALRGGQTEALQAVGAFLGRGAQIPEYAGGGLVEAMNFARAQGGPYVWGGVGPYGYDCSGFQSAIANVALGQYPYRRRFSTASFAGGGGAGGFVPGLNSAYGIGVFQGNPGHMAGTIGGMNVESGSGHGAMAGGAAHGATAPMFNQHFSLPMVGGQFIDGGPGGVPMVSWWSIIGSKVSSLLHNLFGGSIPGIGGAIGQAISRIPGLLIDKAIDALKKKLEALMTLAGSAINTTAQGMAANPLSGMGTADRGAIIPPGASTLFNATGRPEPLTNLDVYERMKPAGLTAQDVAAIVGQVVAESSSGGDVYNVMLPERASVRELADQLDFKRRVARMGRYSR